MLQKIAQKFFKPAILAGVLFGYIPNSGAATHFTVSSTTTADEADANPGNGQCRSTTSHVCTLRAAIQEARATCGNFNITIPAGTYPLTIVGSGEDASVTGDLDVCGTITITGAGASSTTIDATGLGDRVFHLYDSGSTVSINNLKIMGGDARGGSTGAGIDNMATLTLSGVTVTGNMATYGAGIYSENTLTVTNSTISSNRAVSGNAGGLYLKGTTSISNSTISANRADQSGGGVLISRNSGNVTISNSTIVNNESGSGRSYSGGGIAITSTATGTLLINSVTIAGNEAYSAAGIYDESGRVTIRNTLIADNDHKVYTGNEDCTGTLTSAGYNLIEDTTGCTLTGDTTGNLTGSSYDPQLGALANNGGATETQALTVGSPAIDAGNPAGCGNGTTPFTYDQRGRGHARSRDGNGDGTGRCDIGAYEYQVTCGDGITAGAEACDDGNTTDGDGCSSICASEPSTCGNGTREGSEECDDGNHFNTDSCLNNCTSATCGDGYAYVRGGEECDDGNTDNSDACTVLCRHASCGDGILQTGEACDDGNGINTDSCTSSCLQAACGDGYLQSGEECEDGNTTDGDGCSSTCVITSSGEAASCGNGIVEGTEQCDNGSANSSVTPDACRTNCTPARCGDGVIDTGEQCDGESGCSSTCTLTTMTDVCGNGAPEGSEQCDDGGTTSGDGCSSTCTIEWVTGFDFQANSFADEVDVTPGDGYCRTASGACTLRAAVQELSSTCLKVGTLFLPAGTYTLTLVGSGEDNSLTGDLDLCGAITINGAGADSTIINAAGLGDRVFHVNSTITIITLNNLKITGGQASSDYGGGIYNQNSSTLTLFGVNISGNSAQFGGGIVTTSNHDMTISDSTISSNQAALSAGGIHLQGPTLISNSTISLNIAGESAGGIFNYGNASSLTLSNSTISGNSASSTSIGGGLVSAYSTGSLFINNSTISGNSAGQYGGIVDFDGVVTLRNSLIGDNIDTFGSPDCFGTHLTSAGYNFIENITGCTIVGDTTGNVTGIDPQLGALASNGGPTQTQALLAGSPAIDHGNPAGCSDSTGVLLTTDQRGSPRPSGGQCDIGAYEYQTVCGDGTVAVSEECDGGSTCTSDCRIDTDGDGVPDNSDALPNDPTESGDADHDGTGNNADADDDNDGISDTEDTDDDNDGVADAQDAFPLDAAESVDTDYDGVGNNADTDDDGDGVVDDQDAFPLDATQSSTVVGVSSIGSTDPNPSASGTNADGTVAGGGGTGSDGSGGSSGSGSTGTGSGSPATASHRSGGCSLQKGEGSVTQVQPMGILLLLIFLVGYYKKITGQIEGNLFSSLLIKGDTNDQKIH